MATAKPSLIIVTGPPAAGKTSIVEGLAASLRLPFFTKDDIKERFADALGAGAYDHAGDLGKGSQLQLIAIASELIRSGHGVVIESFFHRGITEPHLRPLLDSANTVLVHITAEEDVLVEHYAERMDDPSRHEIHNIDGTPDELRALLAKGMGQPLDLDCPLVVLDTTNRNYDEEEVARLVERALSPN